LRGALAKDLPPDYRDIPTGAWETFDFVSPSIAAGGALTGSVSFPVDAALFEISGAASDPGATEGTATLGYTDLFDVQFTLPDGTALNAGPPLIGTAFFSRLDGIKRFRKPWVIGANQAISISGTSLATADKIVVYLGFTVLLLGLATNAQQF
jgi:hypothetical protein